MQAWTVPALYPVPEISKTFTEQGEPTDKTSTVKRTTRYIDELMWCIEAKRRMSEN